jgi:Putative adhesin
MSTTRWIALLSTAACWASPVWAQSRDTTVRLASSAVVDVTVRTGKLVVRGVDGTSGTVRASGSDYQLRSSGVALVVAPRDGDRRDGERRNDTRGSTRGLELEVPRGVRVVISTLSADVEVYDIAGNVEVRSTSGTLQFSGLGGRLIAETISGDVRSSGNTSLARITTVSGDMRVREARGEVELSTTSGDISVSGENITRFAVEAMSGDVQFDGLLTANARVQVSTHSGDVTLRVPEGIRGRLELSTVTGDLTAGEPLTLLPGETGGSRRGRNARRFEFGPGAGGSGAAGLQMDITTFSGDVRLVRAPRS